MNDDVLKEGGGNDRLYTLEMTGLIESESEVNEGNTEVGNPNYPSDDQPKRP